MQQLRTVLLGIQAFLAPQRTLLTRLFFILELLVVALMVITNLIAQQLYTKYFTLSYYVGTKLGVISLALFCLTVLPGMITRLQWWPLITQPIASILLPHRRHFGILMFLTAWLHMVMSSTLPQLVSNGFDFTKITFAPYELMGEIAWWLLLPLWLTSNDFSQKRLGRFWKMLHKLVYVAMFVIFLHVALQEKNWLFVVGALSILEIISWVRVWQRSKQEVSPPTVTAPIPSAGPQTPPV